jgi:hypothetical protein
VYYLLHMLNIDLFVRCRSSESDDTVGPMRVERRRLVEPAGQRVRSLDAANSRLLAALSDLSEPHTNLLSGSIMTSTLL